MRKTKSVLFLAAAAALASPACAQLRVVTLNSANSDGATPYPRNPYMSTVLGAIGNAVSDDPTVAGNTGISKPIDILCLQEVNSYATTCTSFAGTLNALYPGANYHNAIVDGGSTGSGTQGLVFNANAVSLISTVLVGTATTSGQPRQALRYQLRPVGYDSSADIYVYNSHYKADSDSTSQTRRNDEAVAIRADADALGAGKNIIYLGDFNVYRNTEDMYVTLEASGNGQALDPINKPGSWTSNSAFANVHTQSPYNSTTSGMIGGLSGGTAGGMDDRFDQQLITANLNDHHGVAYITNSYFAFANNGSTYNNPINIGNTIGSTWPVYTQSVLDAVAGTLDHDAVIADYQLPAKLSASLGTVPARVIVGSTATAQVSVSNSAAVSFSNGAEVLNYTLTASGSLTGSTSGSDSALGSGNTHNVTLVTTTVGNKTGSVSVTSSNESVGGSPLAQNVNFTVLDHSNASFDTATDVNAQTIDFGYVPQGFANRTVGFLIRNMTASAFTAKLNLNSVTNSGSTGSLSTNVTTFAGMVAGTQNNYAATLSTATAGALTTTHTFATSDEVIPGASNGTNLVLTTTARVLSNSASPVVFPVTGFMQLNSGETYTPGAVSFAGGITVTKSGPGAFNITGAQTHGANSALAMTGGALSMSTDAGAPGNAPLAISLTNAGTTATFSSSQNLRSLTLDAGTSATFPANGNRTLYTKSLVLNGAKLDLNDNDLIVDYTGASPLTTLQQYVLDGLRFNGDPAATAGISSTAGNNSTAPAGNILVLFENTFIDGGSTVALVDSWDGVTVDIDTVIGKYTFFGDANLDGQVNADDYTTADSNRAVTAGALWTQGDVNLDGAVTPDDYTTMDSNRGQGTDNPLAPQGLSAVPEPAATTMGGFGLGALLTRRARRNKKGSRGL